MGFPGGRPLQGGDGQFRSGRVQTAFALDARRGKAQHARFVCKEELPIPLDTDLATALGTEIERNRAVAERPSSVAAVVGINPSSWRLIRIVSTDDEPDRDLVGVGYEILYLARPLLDTLPLATDR